MLSINDHNSLQKYSWPLMLSPFASQFGSAIYAMGLNWTLVQSSGGTQTLGNIEAIGGLAFLSGDLLVGRLVDKHNRKKVLVWTDLISCMICLAASLTYSDNQAQIWLLTLVTVVLNMMLAINYPAAKSIGPEIIAEANIQSFNAATNTLFNFANIAAPLLGGFLLAFKAITFNVFLAVNGLTFLLAALLNFSIHYQFIPESNSQNQLAKESLFKYLRRKQELIQLIMAMGILNFCASGSLLVSPYIANHFFGHGANNYSIFLTVSAIGGLIGGLSLYLQKNDVTFKHLFQQFIFFGTFLLIAGCFLNYIVWMMIAFLTGLFQARFFASIPTLIQKNTEKLFLGRVFGIVFLFFDGIQPFGSFIFGYMIKQTSYSTYSIIGAILICLFFILLKIHKQNQ